MAKKANQDGLKKLSQTQVYCNVRNFLETNDVCQKFFARRDISFLKKGELKIYKIEGNVRNYFKFLITKNNLDSWFKGISTLRAQFFFNLTLRWHTK